jgi:hypothetical protein
LEDPSKYDRLRSYFDDVEVEDLQQLSKADCIELAAPHDRILMSSLYHAGLSAFMVSGDPFDPVEGPIFYRYEPAKSPVDLSTNRFFGFKDTRQ